MKMSLALPKNRQIDLVNYENKICGNNRQIKRN